MSGRCLGAAVAVLLGAVLPVHADPATFVTVSLVLAGVAFAACLNPARRAMALDPATVLRSA